MHNNDDKYPSRPGFEPCTPSLQALVDTNEPSGPAAASEGSFYQNGARILVSTELLPNWNEHN